MAHKHFASDNSLTRRTLLKPSAFGLPLLACASAQASASDLPTGQIELANNVRNYGAKGDGLTDNGTGLGPSKLIANNIY